MRMPRFMGARLQAIRIRGIPAKTPARTLLIVLFLGKLIVSCPHLDWSKSTREINVDVSHLL